MVTKLCHGASPILLLEHWKPAFGLEKFYEVSNRGAIRNITTGRRVSGCQTKWGYRRIKLPKAIKQQFASVHSIVAQTFLGLRPEGLEINHKDAVKQNNRASNLEYVSRRENFHHAAKLGLMSAFFAKSKLSAYQVRKIRCLIGWVGKRHIAQAFGVDKKVIVLIGQNKIWRDVK